MPTLSYIGPRGAAAAAIGQQRPDHLEDMAHYDGLTDLPNRILMLKRLDQILTRMSHGCGLALLYIDLERFKQVNAALGYRSGDLLLKTVAERLAECTREDDLVARIGNDEFAILVSTWDPPGEGAALARKVIAAISAPVFLGARQLVISANIGIALSPTHAVEGEQLLRCAELALLRLGAEGGRGYCFFQKGMGARAQVRHELEGELRHALAKGELHLHYQPLFDLSRNEISCCEALLRWTHPHRGTILPGSFIPLAEATGLIVPMGEWALREACAQAVTWPENVGVAVNLSPIQFSPSLPQTVAAALTSSGLQPGRLELEVTETVLLKRTHENLAILKGLQALGVRIAMDDFGTGYSSLLYLRSFPFDKIKIDRSFIADLSRTDARSVAILRAAVALGTSLGMTTAAEGVETEEQLEIVRAEGCMEVQGYLMSTPKSPLELASLLAAGVVGSGEVPDRSTARETPGKSCRTQAA